MAQKESRLTDKDNNNEPKNENIHVHHAPHDWGDHVALNFVKFLRFFTDAFFAERYGHRAVVLETIAAVPGMVGGMILHLRSLRRMQDDHGWIHTLLDEAENERMHLMTFIKIAQPTLLERILVILAQSVFYIFYLFLYIISSKTAHRVVGYLEEEAVVSYTQYLECIDKGTVENVPAPDIAIEYWDLPREARLRDVVMTIRADEMQHRDINHCMANKINGQECDIQIPEDMHPDLQEELQECQKREAP